MNKFKDKISPKSFLIAIATTELLLGSFAIISPELFYTSTFTSTDMLIFQITFLVGGLFALLSLETSLLSKKVGFIFSIPAAFPFLYLAKRTLDTGILPSSSAVFVIAVGILATAFLTPKQKDKATISLLGLITGVMSIIIGLSFLTSFIYVHPLLARISNFLPYLSLIFVLTGIVNIKASLQNTKRLSLALVIFSLPVLWYGIYLSSLDAFRVGLALLFIYIMIVLRAALIFLGFTDQENVTTVNTKLYQNRRSLEFAAIGSLLLFITSTFSPIFQHTDKIVVTILVLAFSVATILWFQVLPIKRTSRLIIFSWINLYSLFIVAISIFQSPESSNPLILLYTIPIFACSIIIGKKETIYPTWIAIIGITIATLVHITKTDVEYSKIIINSSLNYISILSITYLCRKIH